ncbi:MAG: TolC family protein [bacterium]
MTSVVMTGLRHCLRWREMRLVAVLALLPLAALLAAWSPRALGAEPAAGGVTLGASEVRLSLEEAVSLAERNNETTLMAIEDEKRAGGVVREAWAGALPSLTLAGTYQRNFDLPVFFVTSDSTTTEMEIGGDLETQGQLRLDQVLYAFGRVGNAVKFAGIYKNIASLGVENARSQVAYTASEAYYRVLLADKVAGIERQSLVQAQAHLREIEQKYAQGTASRFDLLRAQVEAKNREPGLIEAENNLALSIEDLKQVVGLDSADRLVLTDTLAYLPMEVTEEEAIVEALAHRAEVLSLELSVEGRKKLLAIEKAGIFPILSLYGQVQFQGQSGRDDLLGSFDKDNRAVSTSAGIALSVPLFDGFRTRGRVVQARAELKRSEYQLEQARKSVRLEVSKAVRDLASLRKEYESQVATIGLAEEAYRIAETRFRSGLSTQLELTDAETALDFARTNFAQTLYKYNVAAANLERALGRAAGGPGGELD